MMIRSFTGEYRFLSNFFPSPVEFEGLVFPTVEHAFQAAKALSPLEAGVSARDWHRAVVQQMHARMPHTTVLNTPPAEVMGMHRHGITPFAAVTRLIIRNCSTPGAAKRMGRSIHLRADWDAVRIDVMLTLLRAKFSIPTLAARLLDTGDAELVEGNTWHDNFWGDCHCARCAGIPGQNWLGAGLMVVRSELLNGGTP